MQTELQDVFDRCGQITEEMNPRNTLGRGTIDTRARQLIGELALMCQILVRRLDQGLEK